MCYTSREITIIMPASGQKKDAFYKEFPQNTKDSSGSFPEAVVWNFSLKEEFLSIFQNSQEVPFTGVSLLNKVVVPQFGVLFKKRLLHRCFPMNFPKFSRMPLGDCLFFFHYFKRGFSLCISFCTIL